MIILIILIVININLFHIKIFDFQNQKNNLIYFTIFFFFQFYFFFDLFNINLFQSYNCLVLIFNIFFNHNIIKYFFTKIIFYLLQKNEKLIKTLFNIKYFIELKLFDIIIIIIIVYIFTIIVYIYYNNLYLFLFAFFHMNLVSIIFFIERLNNKFLLYIIKNENYFFFPSGEKKIKNFIFYLITGFSKYNFVDFKEEDDLYLKRFSNNFLKLNNYLDLEHSNDFLEIKKLL